MRCRTIRGLVVSTILLSSLAFAAINNPTVIYVNASATGANTGTSWADAFTTLQPALDAAQTGTEIWVAAGTYKPSKLIQATYDIQYKTFQLKHGVGIYGGFAGIETKRDQRSSDPNLTILSGDINGDDTDVVGWMVPERFDNSYHVFYHPDGLNLDAAAILDGFTIKDGNPRVSYGTDYHCGGGMFNGDGNCPTINNCIFKHNAAVYGAGMYNAKLSSPTITRCIFMENAAGSKIVQNEGGYGGGLYANSTNAIISDCAFVNNTAISQGAGILCQGQAILTRCTFQGNSSDKGGGLFLISSGATAITDCVFQENTAGRDGGGIYSEGGSPSLSYCSFLGNSAYYSGGGMYNKGGTPTISHCSFVRNTTIDVSMDTSGGTISDSGAGIFNNECCATITDCIFEENNATYPENDRAFNANGGGINNCKNSNGLIARCAFLRNSAGCGGGVFNCGSSPVVRDCIFMENSAGGRGCLGGGMASSEYRRLGWSSGEKIPSYPIILNCTFERNYTWVTYNQFFYYYPAGGGMYGGYKAVNCVFKQNISAGGGGGLSSCDNVIDCIFEQNEAAGEGGGIGAARNVSNCIFSNNKAAQGGAMTLTSHNEQGSINITDSLFLKNTVAGEDQNIGGGAIYGYFSKATVRDCRFLGNTVHGANSAYGGGIYGYGSILSITNSLFGGNHVQGVIGYGGAICDYENVGTSTIRNCTFLANSATGTTNSFGGGICNHYSDDGITNCILWGNSALQGAQLYTRASGTSVVTYTDVEGGLAGDGNINLPPQVVRYPSAGDDGRWGTADDDYGDLHLLPDSPCVDTGSNAAVPAEETGLLGTPRVVDGDWDGTPVVDMGAYEYHLFGDLNLTADVDMADMHLLAAHWMQTDCAGPDHCGQADINRTGTVDFDDFIILADQWLQSENITPPPPALPSPITMWKMDETEGAVVADSVGGHEGQTVNVEDNPWQAGHHGYALKLDGINDYVQVTGFKGITGTATRTCSAWIKATANSKDQVIVSWGNEAAGQKWMFRLQTDGRLGVVVWNGYIQSSVSVADGQWHHVAALLADDGSPSVNEIKLYVDGFPQTTTYSSTQPIDTFAGQDVQIGAFYNGSAQAGFFNGLLDDVRIYNLDLDENQIYRLSME